MCERCDEIDDLIARYRALQQRVLDQAFIDLAHELIAEKEAEKAALHSE